MRRESDNNISIDNTAKSETARKTAPFIDWEKVALGEIDERGARREDFRAAADLTVLGLTLKQTEKEEEK
jgi:hypothetical protein